MVPHRTGFRFVTSPLILAALTVSSPTAIAGPNEDRDRAEIRRHIESIFEAYIRQDVAAIAATHAEDWVGYFAASATLVRGLDRYLEQAKSSFSLPMVAYEIVEMEIELRGDLAAVFYVATWQNRDPASGHQWQLKARSLDLYERRDGHWIQTGSNLNIVPGEGAFAKPECWACYGVQPTVGSSADGADHEP